MFTRKSPSTAPQPPATAPVIEPQIIPEKVRPKYPANLGPAGLELREKRHGDYYPLALRLELRNLYVKGRGSLPELCRRFSIVYHTASAWSTNEKWGRMRKAWLKKQNDKFDLMADEPADSGVLPNTGNFVNDQRATVEIRIKETNEAMARARAPRELRELAVSLKLLWDTWSLITGHPRPGTRRQSRKGQGARQPQEFVPLSDDPPA